MKKPWSYVLLGGLIAGTLDIVYACTFWFLRRGVMPRRILQSVASGLLGDASFTGGWPTGLLGFVLQYFIASSLADFEKTCARLRRGERGEVHLEGLPAFL